MYTPLKVTTDYTLLKSLIKVDDLISFCVSKKISACAICDENLSGVYEFYYKCLKNNIKPIIGLSIYINNLNIYLYAINYNGYKNLIKINTKVEKKELTIIDLKEYKEDLLCIIPFESKDIYESLSFIKYIYLGYKNEYEKNNVLLITNNIVYINDIRYLNINDAKYMKYLDMLRKENIKDYSNNYYMDYTIDNLDKHKEIINLINIEFPNNKRYIPKYNNNSKEFLYKLASKGLEKRLKSIVTQEYKDRLYYELNVIETMGYIDYFLIVYDYVLYAKKHGILVGCRGSAAGSLVSYSIGITDIDPLKYDLLFERFLNPERITMPDIDIDFDALKREEVIAYVREKYGNTKVALGLTYNTLKSKLVIREIGKLLKIDDKLIDKFARSIDGSLSLKNNLENNVIKKYLDSYKELKELYSICMRLEGIKKNTSTHAAGVVISSENLDEIIPIHYENDTLLTGITMDYLEDIGLLKMDFLGLKNLTIISNIKKNIGSNELNNIDLNDPLVYKLFCEGDVDGIFQFETPAMRNLLTKLQPKCFNDLIAGVALGRPGPKDHALDYVSVRDGKKKVEYLHPDLEPILNETNGVLIYQEQIMAILVKFGGYKMSEADLIRRAVSKKKEDVLKSEFAKFVKRAMNNGYEKETSIKIYNLIVKFASYGFNKSHSVAYAYVAYLMAYLKVYYPVYFIIELLNDSKDQNKNIKYLNYLKKNNIKIIKPNANMSGDNYIIRENNLIMPLTMIKNISLDIANKIIDNKKDGYTDYFDFVLKNKDFLTEGILTILVNSGALDFLGLNHQTMINNMEVAFNYADIASFDNDLEKPSIILYEEYNKEILRKNEIDSFGFYITNHPASQYRDSKYMKLQDIKNYLFKKIECVIIVDNIKKIKTKKNEDMAFISGSDDTGVADFTVFPDSFKSLNNINNKDLILVSGEVTKRFDKIGIIVNNIKVLGDKDE